MLPKRIVEVDESKAVNAGLVKDTVRHEVTEDRQVGPGDVQT